MIPDIVYLKKIAFDNFNIKKENEKVMSKTRNDVFIVKAIGKEQNRIILNENKLQTIYK